MTINRVLVTGGAGYIGSVLVELLLDAGYDVRVLDRFFFGPTLEHLESNDALELVKGDIRWASPEVLEGVDAVMDLAALSNDPAGELNPAKTLEINHQGRARMCELAAGAGVQRYILASSCSIYGFQDGVMNEGSDTNPLTTYAEANLLAERSNLPRSRDDFAVTVLRQATVYGLSSRMRYDLAVNGMTLGLLREGKVPILRDGSQWRPMVHVRDTSRAFITALQADQEIVAGQVFNVGSNDQNFQILPLAREVAEGVGVEFDYEWYGDPDHRSYQVDFSKIELELGYKTERRPEDAAREIRQALEDGSSVPDARTKTVEWYSSLIDWHDIIHDVELDNVIL